MTRVALTTDRFDEVAGHFRSRSLSPVHIPCVRVDPAAPEILASARTAVSGAGLALLTSSRTVSILWPDQEMPPVRIVAVGETTAASATDAGGEVVFVGDGGLDAVIGTVIDLKGDAPVVFPHGVGTEPTALARLRAAIPELEEHLVYASVSIPAAATSVDSVVFASPSAVRGWLSSRGLDGLVVCALGATTARALPRPPDLVPPIPSYQAVAEQLSAYLGARV